MTLLSLKSYQQAALDALRAFARAAQIKGPALAFGELVGRPYNPEPFGDVSCICLRIPTGGGKTLMAAHAVAVLAQEWRATDAPVAVWLVPSDTIRSQTLKALQTSGHPYREPLLIVDEADNTKTDKRFTALKRLNPSAILELTATPLMTDPASKTNVLYHVSAQELDCRVAVVEYKGAHHLGDPYEIEKRHVGELWARKSAGKCLFGQIVKEAQINSSWRAITWLGRSAALLFLQISRYLLQKAPCNPSQPKRRASTRINLRFLKNRSGLAMSGQLDALLA